MMDWNWASYLLGVVSGVVVMILSAFFGEAGKDLYSWIKLKIRPPEPEPVQIGRNFRPTHYALESCVWAKENFVPDKLEAGYICYRDPDDGAARFRISNPSAPQPVKEFLMLKPDAEKANGID